MDLLYSRYSNPLEFMHLYIEQGRFGEFVEQIVELDNKRKKEEVDKENEEKLWQMYIHSMSDKSFNQWKDELINGQPQNQKSSLSMTDKQIEEQKNKARNILKKMKF